MPPTEPLQIHAAAFPAPFGQVMAAAGDGGVLAIGIETRVGAAENSLLDWARSLGANGTGEILCSPDATLERLGRALEDYFKRRLPIPPLPLDLRRGTPFQRQVWQALCHIPHGETRSYQHLADQIGRPRAARAVGQACGRNPIPILVPCHRVITSSGRLGGFSSGLAVKRSLLDLEQPPA
ncbi:MAG: hypothetical protein COT06_05220 [Syntrophobacteraceae bacterium CG07_land_8_20_14_0_80_61_8]|nr:MAG: hypothetical protein COT06_05220 [Syntrophobacteraceae bacterium CG07_land_8_20_14_0_80_61_8]